MKISAYVVLVGSYKLVSRLPCSYVPFAYRYPTNILLQYLDRTAFALAVLMLFSLGTATYICVHIAHTTFELHCFMVSLL